MRVGMCVDVFVSYLATMALLQKVHRKHSSLHIFYILLLLSDQ